MPPETAAAVDTNTAAPPVDSAPVLSDSIKGMNILGTGGVTSFSAGTMYYASHKGMGGCGGQLVLNSKGLSFGCSGNALKGFAIGVGEISGIDDDGIRLYSGKKYHFSIGKASKEQVAGLFTHWLALARVVNAQGAP
jgi:hypothetical protein